MGSRLVELAVALGAVVSAVLLGAMLAAPWLPQPSVDLAAPSASPRPSATATPDPALPPIGLYQMRNAFSFGPCLAIELEPESYPVAEGAEGTARVHWWVRGMTGCDSRTGEVQRATARTHVVPDPADPDSDPVGYTVEFSLPLVDFAGAVNADQTVRASLTILARQSTQTLLQAVEDAPGSGQGYVLDRVAAVEPRLDPLPSPAAQPGAGLTGLFLLRGPLGWDGPCLAIELTNESYPPEPGPPAGPAGVLWWERGGTDLEDPAVCFTRSGEIHDVTASVIRNPAATGALLGYLLTATLPLSSGGVAEEVEIGLALESRNPDQIQGVMVRPAGTETLFFDRVDELNPPPAPAP